MRETYEFIEAAPFVEWLDKNKSRFVGQKIKEYYSDAGLGSLAESPIVLVLENFCVILNYFWLSNITIHIVDRASFMADNSLNFLYKDSKWSRNLTQ